MKIKGKDLSPVQMANELWSLFSRDSLFRNSVYLMLSTAVMSGLGFFFMVIATRFYSSEEIGFATTLISITVLISSWSLFGLNSALVRFLAQSSKPSRVINTSLIIVAATTATATTIYLLGIDYFSPKYHILVENPLSALLFILFMIAVSLNSLTDSVFVSYRLAKYNLIVYTFFGLTKIALVAGFFFMTRMALSPALVTLGSYGVFLSYAGAVLVSLFLSIYLMARKFNYHPQLVVDRDFTKKASRFSLATYAAGFISGLPGYLVPIFIFNEIGERDAAYFYMATTIAALLYIIPQAISQSLFAEGAFREQDFRAFVQRAIKLIAVFLLPAILAILFFGKYILLIFGAEYSANSNQLLQIMALTSIFLAIDSLGSTIMKIKHQMKLYIGINAAYSVFTVALIYVLLPYGTPGIAWALLGGQAFLSVCFIIIYRKRLLSLFVR